MCLNSVFIGKIQEWFPKIENIYVPPVPYDSGLTIGSAQYLWHQLLDKPRIRWDDNFTPYLGRSYGLQDVEESLENFKSQKLVGRLSMNQKFYNFLMNKI